MMRAARQGRGARRVGLHARRLVARPVRRRLEAVHARGAGQGRARQPGASCSSRASETYLNSQAIEAIGLEKMNEPWIERDANGRATGVIDGAGAGACGTPPGSSRTLPKEIFESEQHGDAPGLSTAPASRRPGGCALRERVPASGSSEGRPCDALLLPAHRRQRRRQRPQNVEPGHRRGAEAAATSTATSGSTTPTGASGSINTPDTVNDTQADARRRSCGRSGAASRVRLAKAGIPIFIHSTMEWTIEEQLKQVETIAKEVPIRHLRWAFMHMEGVTPPRSSA